MKRCLLSFLPLFFLSLRPEASPKEQLPTDPITLAPTATQKEVEKVVTNILSNYHYRKLPLNDSLSAKVWKAYFQEVDGNKFYLLASDVASFDKHKYQVDDYLLAGDVQVAYNVFNVFLKRFRERIAFAKTIAEKPFDFTTDEAYQTDRDKATWATSTQELDELWRKVVKSQALQYKLDGKADTTTARLLKERYTNLDKQFSKIKSDYVFSMFMNAFSEQIDPHTTYMAPPDASRFKDEMAQSFEGIGATLVMENDYTKIKELHAGGPAMKSNLVNVNDRIVGVAQGENGQLIDVVGWALDDVVKLIRGAKGTTVRLNLLKADAVAGMPAKEIKLVRDKIKLEDGLVKGEVIPLTYNKKEYKLGIITIPGFYQGYDDMRRGDKDYTSTSRDVQRLLEQFKTEKTDGIVIDLRNNGGGSLDEAIKLSGLFIKDGPVVQVKDAMGRIDVDNDPDPAQIYDGPLAVMVNRFSASASEIFAGAIQDYRRGVVLGEQTFGKGTVQQLLDLNQFLPNEKDKVGLLKMTRAKFYRITGSSTQHKGVMPDIVFPSRFTSDEYGESSQPTALPWDQINTAKFTPYDNLTDKTIEQLRSRFNNRLKTEPELVKLTAEVADFQKYRERTEISLNEAKRKKETEALKQRKDELTKQATSKPNPYEVVLLSEKMAKLGGGIEGQDVASVGNTRQKMIENFVGKFKDDVQMKETTRILADLLSLK